MLKPVNVCLLISLVAFSFWKFSARPVPAVAASPSTLSVTLAGEGGGAVNSNPAGIACTAGDCSSAFESGTTVTLMAVADVNSTFAGWSGACTNASGDCTVTLDAARSVTATFDAGPYFLTTDSGGTNSYFISLQKAYSSAHSGTIIKGRSVTVQENVVANLQKQVMVQGGYDTSFSSINGVTTVNGKMLIRQGAVRVDKISVH